MRLLRNAEVFRPEAVGRRDILVAGERIVAMAPEIPRLPAATGCVEEDLGGARVIAGLIDLHAHVTGGGGESGPASRVPPLAADPIARAGITTIVGLLGTDCTTRSPRELVARTLGLREEGLSAWCWTGGYEVPPPTLTGSVRGDLVYVDPVLGAGEVAISDHRSSQPTLDELLRLAADCHVGGLMSGKAGVLHLHVGDGSRGLSLLRQALEICEIPPRVFHPTHVNRQPRLLEEAFELAALGCTVDVTAFPPDPNDPAVSAVDAIERWLASGLPVERLTISSDGGGCLPTFDRDGRLISMEIGRPAAVSDTLRALLDRGHALDRVLPFFTTNPARLLRLSRKGHLGVGADADLVVLGPAGEVSRVMARGHWWGER